MSVVFRVQRLEAEKEERSREEVTRRTEAVLALKNSIAVSKVINTHTHTHAHLY